VWWQGGITGIGYDPALTGREITKFDDLLDPEFKGRVGGFSDMRDMMTLCLASLGIDPSTATVAQAQQARDKLLTAAKASRPRPTSTAGAGAQFGKDLFWYPPSAVSTEQPSPISASNSWGSSVAKRVWPALMVVAVVLISYAFFATGGSWRFRDGMGYFSALGDAFLEGHLYLGTQPPPELANDPMLGGVGWSWLMDALAQHDAPYVAEGGTVTRVVSETFASLDDRQATVEMEIRASWTPTGPDLSLHLLAWADLLCTIAGLPPLPEGVVALPGPRR